MDTTNLKQRAARIATLKKELEASEQNTKVAEQHAETLREQRFDVGNAYGREHRELAALFRAPAQALELIEHVAWLEEVAKEMASHIVKYAPMVTVARSRALDVLDRLTPNTEGDRTDGVDAMAYMFAGTKHRRSGKLWASPELTHRLNEMSKAAHEPKQDKVDSSDSTRYHDEFSELANGGDMVGGYTKQPTSIHVEHNRAGDVSTTTITAAGLRADKQIQPELTKQHTGQWLSWQGGERPVSPATRVQVTLRGGQTYEDRAECFRWEHRGALDDVVTYRVVQPEQLPKEDPTPPAKPKLGEGWSEWAGGLTRPCDRDDIVEVMLRGDRTLIEPLRRGYARDMWWHHVGADNDIIAYRVVQP